MTFRWYFGSSVLLAVAVACNLSSQPIPPELGADQVDAGSGDARSVTTPDPDTDAAFLGGANDREAGDGDASGDASSDAASDAPSDGG